MCTPSTFAASGPFNQYLLGQCIHVIYGIPGTFIADTRELGSLADGTGMLNLL
ncbi:hypothetical [Yersinia pestis KIM10+]|uniref:Uncharacterized protein n=1 Tax=Yersinia pestis TaxID=632 RepID=Q8CKR1_YERPE|nr:hypothetical [Yersinia pestis KIM10+]